MSYIILAVEDEKPILDLLKEELIKLGKNINLVQAFTLSQGFYTFNVINQIGINIFCSILGGQLGLYSTTLPLLKVMKEKGISTNIISFSGDEVLQEEQMKNGCTAQFKKNEIKKMVDFIGRLIADSEKK